MAISHCFLCVANAVLVSTDGLGRVVDTTIAVGHLQRSFSTFVALLHGGLGVGGAIFGGSIIVLAERKKLITFLQATFSAARGKKNGNIDTLKYEETEHKTT